MWDLGILLYRKSLLAGYGITAGYEGYERQQMCKLVKTRHVRIGRVCVKVEELFSTTAGSVVCVVCCLCVCQGLVDSMAVRLHS